MEVYTFDKSLQERLTEYKDILSDPRKTICASQIQSEWSCDTEIVIEPTGWQALWNLSRVECEEYEIRYPTIVLVEVVSVDCASLSARVQIKAVQDDIHLPEKHDVPLIELHPTIIQPNSTLDIEGTAHLIDKLRFFYTYLWMPWDQDDDDNIDWVNHHLESRIRLAFDMKRGIINKETCDLIRSLMKEGKEIEKKITILEASISDEEDVHEAIANETCQLMKLHLRLQQVKSEMEVLENPAMREILVRNQSLITEKKKSSDDKNRKNVSYFVWLGDTYMKLREAFNKVEKMIPYNLTVKVCGNLDEALHMSDTGDIILLGEGNHPIKTASGLEEGGIIKGIYNKEFTVLCPKEFDSAMTLLDFSSIEMFQVLLENVCIDLGERQIGIIVRKGIVKIINCKIHFSSQSTVKLGIVIMPGAKLIVEHTVFEGLGTAMVICANSEVVMKECYFANCGEGIQLTDNAHITAEKCLFEGFKECAIRMETHKYLKEPKNKLGNSELLNNVSEVILKECKFANNSKADVMIKLKGNIALTEQ